MKKHSLEKDLKKIEKKKQKTLLNLFQIIEKNQTKDTLESVDFSNLKMHFTDYQTANRLIDSLKKTHSLREKISI